MKERYFIKLPTGQILDVNSVSFVDPVFDYCEDDRAFFHIIISGERETIVGPEEEVEDSREMILNLIGLRDESL